MPPRLFPFQKYVERQLEVSQRVSEVRGLTGWFTFLQVFLKYYHVEQLNLLVQQATQRVVLLQAYIRGWLGARRYRRTLSERERSALVLQSGL